MKRLALLTLALAGCVPASARAAESIPACPPTIGAPAAIVMEASTGDIACGRQIDQRRAIASTTKLMTALLTLENAKLSDVIPAVRFRGLAVESQIGLAPGERLTVADLLRGLLVYSANDAARTLAVGVGGSEPAFVRQMNARAAALGLRNTHYANPVGLDDKRNYSTPRDLAKLALELRKFSFFRKTVARAKVTLESGAHPRFLINRNLLVARGTKYVTGIKTGHTGGAGWVLVGSGRKRGVGLITVALADPSEARRLADTQALLDYGWHRYRVVRPVKRGQVLASSEIRYRRGARLKLISPMTVRRVIRRGTAIPRVDPHPRAPARVTGPIRGGDRLATAQVRLAGRVIATVPLVAEAGVPEAGLAQRTKDYFTRPLTMVLLLLLGGPVIHAHPLQQGRPRRRRCVRRCPGRCPR